MSQKAIVTQAEIAAFKDSVNQIAGNLNAHINHSLSKAHGIDIVPGYIDADLNDRTTYQNSHGDIIGTYMIRFAVNGVLYYAPGVSTALAGQPASDGALDTNPDITTALGNPGSASLITEYGSIEVEQAQNVNDYLLEHTRTNHDLVHSEGGVMRAITKSTFDNAGFLIGRYVIRFVVDGIEYEIPCDTRIGGPPQPPRIDVIPASIYIDNIPSPYGKTITPTILGGTKPITFSWEYYNNGTWTTLTIGVTTNVPFVGHPGNSILTEFHDPSTGTLQFDSGAPGGNNFDYVRYRLTASNVAGSVTTDPQGNVLYFDFQVQDKAPCCWFCTQSNISKRIAPEDWQTIGRIEQELFRKCPRMVTWYVRQGETLVGRMVGAGVAQAWFEDFTSDLLAIYKASGMDAAAKFYVNQVGDMADKFWSDCTHRGYKAGLEYRRKFVM